MARTDYRSVDEYIAAQPPAARPALLRVRGAVRKAVPGAEETISYQIPTFKLAGEYVVYFAGWKQHYSLYPVGAPVVAALGDAVERYELSKGTIRFPLDEPVPVRLVARIAKLLAASAAERAEAKRERQAKKKAAKKKAAKRR
jgi:uncharacterized protein YdhG (YjbR/CyaY superfamily)